MTEDAKKLGLVDSIRSLPANFWFANLMEIFERLAFFGVRAVAPLFLVKAANENGLGLDYVDKGNIYMVWALLQCLIPMVSGGYTERYGYKKSLVVAFSLNIIGYLGMARALPIAAHFAERGSSDAGYWVFLIAACFVATGTAIFKPPVHGTIAKTTTEATSSMGWGLFYWVVNIGGALAPMAAATLRGEIDWHVVFYGAAIVTAFNFLPALFLYREPPRVAADGTSAKQPANPDADSQSGSGADAVEKDERQPGPLGVFVTSIATVFKDLRLVMFLLIFSCFWLMFMQLWDLLPNFIDEWVNTADVAPAFAAISSGWVLENGQVKPEMIININPLSIIVLVIFISWLVGKVNKVLAMIIGMLISLVGFIGAGITSVGVFCCIMILVFSIGEMTCSPTFSAYVGLIAPPDKKALYMGYSNIPFAVGWALGNKIGGNLYESMASKFKLARAYLADDLGLSRAFVEDQEMLPNEQVMQTMGYLLEREDAAAVQEGIQRAWREVDWSSVAQEDVTAKVDEIYSSVLGPVDAAEVARATRILWDRHEPYMVWYYLGIIGLVGTIGMIVFYFATKKATASKG